MPLIVNSNIASLNAQRNLVTSTNALQKSLERLSSGYRINRAGDDAAGLAISEGLISQVRGLNQAVRNANDGVSLIATAEGAIGTATSLVQRIRELAVQAANDINSAQNRASLQQEANQLIEELGRIAATVEFNGTTLLDGTFTSKSLQVGANAGETMTISIEDVRPTSLGAVATATGTEVQDELAAGDLLLNGTDVGASTGYDSFSYSDAASSAISIAAAINSVTGTTSVEAEANDTVFTGVAAVGAATLDGTATTLVINGVNIGAVTASANDSDGALRTAINNISNQTGVAATLDGSNQLVLTAADGRNITLTTTGGVDPNETAVLLGLDAADNLTDDITRGTVTVTGDEAFAISGANVAFAGLTAGAVAVDATTAINTVDVTSQSGANAAIRTADFALRQINANRADLGALTNRLEATVSNMMTVAENLSASNSRIKDADFAAETAELTRNQILQQAGTAILAQANMIPQTALSLLR